MFKSKIENISKLVTEYIESVKTTEVDKKEFQKELKKILKKSLKKYIKNHNIDKPKRPKTSFILFCDDERPNIKKDFPTYLSQNIIVELGKRWGELKNNNPEKVKKFEDLAVIHKQTYLKSMKEYENRENDVSDDDSEENIDPKEEKRKLKEQEKEKQNAEKSKLKADKSKLKEQEKEKQKSDKSKLKEKEKEKQKAEKSKLKEQNKTEKISSKKENKTTLILNKIENLDTDEEDEDKEDNIELKKIDKKEVIQVEKIDKKEVIQVENKKQYSFETFCKKKSKKIKKQNPELSDDQIKKKIENKWSKLSEEKRQKYI